MEREREREREKVKKKYRHLSMQNLPSYPITCCYRIV